MMRIAQRSGISSPLSYLSRVGIGIFVFLERSSTVREFCILRVWIDTEGFAGGGRCFRFGGWE